MKVQSHGVVDLFFSDLNEEAQKQLLEALELTGPEEANWESFPIATFFVGTKDD